MDKSEQKPWAVFWLLMWKKNTLFFSLDISMKEIAISKKQAIHQNSNYAFGCFTIDEISHMIL